MNLLILLLSSDSTLNFEQGIMNLTQVIYIHMYIYIISSNVTSFPLGALLLV